eukprot:Skav231525  [mRNA]  locus=scaffold84:656645:660777:- [translate_table: standard]
MAYLSICLNSKVVILQPDAERLRHFDQLVVLRDGRIVESGKPEEVMQSEEPMQPVASCCIKAEDWHRIVAVNDVMGDAKGMAQELCRHKISAVSFAGDQQALRCVGIVGTTGCGKSSFLLVLLRVLEPRGGRVLLNKVDTRDIGLATLREAMGLVPQDWSEMCCDQ